MKNNVDHGVMESDREVEVEGFL